MRDKTIDPGAWDTIVDACEMDGFKAEDVRRDYGYRDGYGQTCIGVVGADYGDVVQFMVNVVESITFNETEQKNWLILMAKNMQTDGMGKNHVIYYFPGWTVSDG